MDIKSPDDMSGNIEGTGQTSPRRRALIVTNHLTYAIHHRKHLLTRLRDEGYEITIAGTGTQAEIAELNALGLEARYLSVVSYRMNPAADAALIPAIRKLIAEIEPDILHLFTPKVIACGKIACARPSRRKRPMHLVLSLTGLGRLFLPDAPLHHRTVRNTLLKVLQWQTRHTSQVITVETSADRDELNSLAPATHGQVIVTHGTGIDLEAFHPVPRSGPVRFLFSGRLLKSKGVETFVAAAQKAITDGIDAHFLIAGGFDANDDDCAPSDLFNTIGSSSQVSLLGPVPPTEMPDVLQRADVVCLPTQYKEGIPRTLLEGAASGCAFIACRTPGWVETVGHDPTSGWFVDPNDVDGLADIMRQAARQRDLTRQAGVAARQTVEKAAVSEPEVQERYLSAYRENTHAR